MPACGCPDVKLANDQIRACTCQPCSSGSLSDCSCNKETGCGCSTSVLPLDSPDRCPCAASGKTCGCSGCACKSASLPGTCAKVEVASWKWDSYIRRQTQGLTGINQRCEGVLPIVAKTFSNMNPNCKN
ncbi:hypothetical protein PSHT_08227 [Puccinia striiformis]|uniref:Uncharacterized protein n=1 Tax=Puccinia striiformis TaxID=27350 RepID=A0A2S4VR18_9BASI|nr:hypothetical protein PSHT_08227 [Puccinia striiformis]